MQHVYFAELIRVAIGQNHYELTAKTVKTFLEQGPRAYNVQIIRGVTLHFTAEGRLVEIVIDPPKVRERSRAMRFVGFDRDCEDYSAKQPQTNIMEYFGQHRRVLIDTSAFYALVSTENAFHVKSRLIWEYILDHNIELWTTPLIIAETTETILKNIGQEAMNAFNIAINSVVRVLLISFFQDTWNEFMNCNHKHHLKLIDLLTCNSANKILKCPVFTFNDQLREVARVVPLQ
jgi:predicted nucleic acid-binding protein